MKPKSVLVSILILMALLLPLPAIAHVGLDNPVGGEVFVEGDTVNIEWTVVVPHNQENWDLHFSSDGGSSWEVIELDLPVDQFSYQWIVPRIRTDEGKIRIYMDNTGGDYLASSNNFSIREIPVSVREEGAIPLSFTLYPNYPNPFNPVTTIEYILPEVSTVSLVIYSLNGEEIVRLIDGVQNIGVHKVMWDAAHLASGVYFYRLKAGEFVNTRKMLLMK